MERTKKGKMMISAILFALLMGVVSGSSYEDNSTNVGVYVNHVSSCNLNHVTGNMLCINRDYESVIQYHDVREATFCPYHYCVLFRTDEEKVTCTGYVYLKMSGSMDEYLNPLTPNVSNEKFTGDPDNDYIKINTAFLGYNVLVDRFEQSVETSVGKPIRKVTCMDPYSTCIEHGDGSSECFGAKDVVFHGFIESALLGLVVPGALAFAVYIIGGGLYKGCLINPCFSVITIPLFVAVCCALILFVASDFIVKMFPFIIASLFGIILGFLLAKVVFGAITVWKKQFGSRVDTEYGSGESTGMLHNKYKDGTAEGATGGDAKFEIGSNSDDEEDIGDGLTEIELGTLKKQ